MATKDHSIVHVIFVLPLWSIQHSFASDQREAVHVGRIRYTIFILRANYRDVGRLNLVRLHLKFGSSLICFPQSFVKGI